MKNIPISYRRWAMVTFALATLAAPAIFFVTLNFVQHAPVYAIGNGSPPDPTAPIFGSGVLLSACATLWAAGQRDAEKSVLARLTVA